jgi:hypothetical protein
MRPPWSDGLPPGAEAAKRACALDAIARGAMRTRASGLGVGGENGATSKAPQPVAPLEPIPLPAEVKALASDWPAPPPATLAAELCPGGANHCGGDYVCIDLTLVNPAFKG